MCDFEDMDIVSRYSPKQAVEDEVLVELLRFNGRPVTATSAIRDDFGLTELFNIWHEFQAWKETVEPYLPDEEKLFSIEKESKKIWVCEDHEGYCIMYPGDY